LLRRTEVFDYRTVAEHADEALEHAEDCDRCRVQLLLIDAVIKADQCGDPTHAATAAWYDAGQRVRNAFEEYASETMRPFRVEGASGELLFRMAVAWEVARSRRHTAHSAPTRARQ
jgi:hypothetical protein